MGQETKTHVAQTLRVMAGALVCTAGFNGTAHAFAIDTGNPDIDLRWDNTVSYTGGMRTDGTNPAFYNSPSYDETEGRFKRGDIVTNRFDLLSELDMSYKNLYGFRVSGAAWYDAAYTHSSYPNPNLPVSGNYRNNRFNSYADRYIVGPSGELLDAFGYGTFNLGGTTLNMKVGQHNVYWGESLYSVSNSIAYSQGPVDTIKAANNPGAQAKELFMPLNQISAQLQLTGEWSVAGEYMFDWKPYRLVPGGTYFSTADAARADYAANLPGFNLPNGPDIGPNRDYGNFGVNVRWSPNWLAGTTAGLYYRRFDEMLPWSITQIGLAGGTPVPSAVRFVYARNTQLFGFSFTKNLGTLSIGSELSYRKNTALNSVPGYTVFTPNGGDPSYDQAQGARGDTLHALVNGIWLLPRTPLWTGGTLQAELTYSRLLRVTANPNLYYGEGYACPVGKNRWDGCSTRDAVGTKVAMTPQWPQAFPGWDLSMPTVVGYQIYGNGAALGGGNQGAVTFSIGIAAELYSRYDFSLLFSDSYARYKTNPATGIVATTNGPAVQNSHALVFATFKTTF